MLNEIILEESESQRIKNLKELIFHEEFEKVLEGLKTWKSWTYNKDTFFQDLSRIIGNTVEILPSTTVWDLSTKLSCEHNMYLSMWLISEVCVLLKETSSTIYLDFSCYPLSSLPENFCEAFRWLEDLRMNDCGICLLPDNFDTLSSLKNLELRGNNLSILPDFGSCLYDLRKVDLSNNSFFEIPSTLSNCANLKYLHMNSNQISSINVSYGFFELEHLHLRDNSISSLDYEISNLTNLTVLNVRDNTLNYYNNVIEDMKNLRVIDLRGTYMDSVPLSSFRKNLDLYIVHEDPIT